MVYVIQLLTFFYRFIFSIIWLTVVRCYLIRVLQLQQWNLAWCDFQKSLMTWIILYSCCHLFLVGSLITKQRKHTRATRPDQHSTQEQHNTCNSNWLTAGQTLWRRGTCTTQLMDPFVLSHIAAVVEVNKKWITEFLPIEVQVEGSGTHICSI